MSARTIDEFIKSIDEEKWQKMSKSEKLRFLQNFENIMAAKLKCEPVKISIAREGGALGSYCRLTNQIHINSKYFETRKIKKNSQFDLAHVLETIAHEGRHAWQGYVLKHPEKYDVDPDTLKAMQLNFEHYTNQLPAYGMQIIELDARRFARETMQYISGKLSPEQAEFAIHVERVINDQMNMEYALGMQHLMLPEIQKIVLDRDMEIRMKVGEEFKDISVFGDALALYKTGDIESFVEAPSIKIGFDVFHDHADDIRVSKVREVESFKDVGGTGL